MVIGEAYASCIRDARAHYENFPVASLLVPRRMRPHIAAVYAFARAADDFADEGARTADERHALLDGWLHRLRNAVSSELPGPPPCAGEPANTVAIFLALGASVRERTLPLEPFEDLVSAFRQDVTVTRYPTWETLLDYCRRSANPIGRLVLRIAGLRRGRLDEWSDAICTALQLTNFWQDLRVDFARGRLYLPEQERRAHGALEADLAGPRLSSAWCRALGAAARRTRALFEAGYPLCDAVGGRLRYELRATWLGGMRLLNRLEERGFDQPGGRITIRAADAPWLAWRMVTWPSHPRTIAPAPPSS
jgi:squalene synthase HpnC